MEQFQEDTVLEHPEEVIDFIRVFNKGNMAAVEKDMIEKVKKGEAITMCNIVQEIQDDARQEGMREGIREGIRILIVDNLEEGVSEDRIIAKLVKRFELSEDEAKQAIEQYGKVTR